MLPYLANFINYFTILFYFNCKFHLLSNVIKFIFMEVFMKRKSLISLVVALALVFTSITSSFAWNGGADSTCDTPWEYSWWTENASWNDPNYGYPAADCNLTYSSYLNLGKPISVTIVGNGVAYPECANLSDVDLVARCIYAEVCNLSDIGNNAVAVAQVIKNRMGTTKTARTIVTATYQFDACFDGNSRFKDPSLDNNPDAWAKSCFLAYQLVTFGALPISSFTNLGNRQFYYDLGWGMPFYLSNKTQCTSSNVTSAAFYYIYSKYNPITTSVIKIGNHCYYNY